MAYRDEREALRARATAAERRAAEAEEARRKAETEAERLRDALEETQREPARLRPVREVSRAARALLVGFVATAIGVAVARVLPSDPPPTVSPVLQIHPPPSMPSWPRAPSAVTTVARWPLRVLESDVPSIGDDARCELRGWVQQTHTEIGYLDRVAVECVGSLLPLADSGPGVAWGPPIVVGETAVGALRYRFVASAPLGPGDLHLDPRRLEVQIDGELGSVRFAMMTPWSEPERVALAVRDAPRLAFDLPEVRRARVVRVRGRAPAVPGASCELVISPTTEVERCVAVVRCGSAMLLHDSSGELGCGVQDGGLEIDSPRFTLHGSRATVRDPRWNATLTIDEPR